MNVRRVFLAGMIASGFVLGLASSEELPPGVLNVARAENANRKFLTRTPAFTCLETIDRRQAGRGHAKAHKVDVVQVEVGVGAGYEIYSWPGQHTFSDSTLGELVGHGLISTGMFQIFAANLFIARAGVIKFIGSGFFQGRSALRFSYEIPSLKSEWNVNWMGASGSVGEQGEFWVDAGDYTLLRLAAEAVDIPPSIPLSSMKVVIDYEAASADGEKALVPNSAQINVTEMNGRVYQNRVFFSHCHVFSSTAVLLAAPEDLGHAISQYELRRQMLPKGLKLRMKLLKPIDSHSAKIGDSIAAELESSVPLGNGQMIPAGALVNGYIREFERTDFNQSSYIVGLEFDEIRWADHTAGFFGKEISANNAYGTADIITRGELQPNGQMYTTNIETFTAPEIPGVATFFLRGQRSDLPRGFEMVWQTGERSRGR